MRFPILLLLACALSASSPKDDVIQLVQKTFDAMAAHDAAAIEAGFLKDARLVAVRESGETSSTAAADFAQRLGANKSRILERMWNPEVRIAGRMATLWAPYDFHRDGKRTHCGIDQVDLVQTAEGWRIAAIVYTVQTANCADSPLGPVN